MLKTYLSGINFFFKLAVGVSCPSLAHAHIPMLLKGLQKSEPTKSFKRLPLTSDLLSRCILKLRSGYLSVSVDLTLECMFLLAFYGFLRCSEFAPTSSKYNPSIHLRLSDLSMHMPDSLIFTLRKSKTDQLGLSFPIYLFRLDSILSPLEPLTKYITFRLSANASPQDPLFLTESGKMATRFWFSKHFFQILRMSGISPDYYSIHSFRIGAASTAAKAGIPDHKIQALGRWSSHAYHTYIRNSLDDLPHAHSLLSSV